MSTKKEQAEIVQKGWGSEVIFANNEMYCGKLLRFNKGARFSMHFHMKKDETWYLAEGTIRLNWIDTKDASKRSEVVRVGEVIRNRPGEPHQVEALSDAVIFEVSTTHFDEDSYRVERGDSQYG
jgi:mannose-6-phosphate isomerase-like protein (cupin superfamily)